MKILKSLLLLLLITTISCSSEGDRFPIEKPYWTPEDYFLVIPETSIVVEKLVDPNNYLIVLNDTQLGLTHKNKVATAFFTRYKDISDIYYKRDRKDNFVYENEMLAVYGWGLGLQMYYFKLGNDNVIKGSDDPNSNDVQRLVNSNISTLIGNYSYYLDFINDEDSFSKKGLTRFSKIMDLRFSELVETYPKANYFSLKNKLKLLGNKAKNSEVKAVFIKIEKLITEKQKVEKEVEVSL